MSDNIHANRTLSNSGDALDGPGHVRDVLAVGQNCDFNFVGSAIMCMVPCRRTDLISLACGSLSRRLLAAPLTKNDQTKRGTQVPSFVFHH